MKTLSPARFGTWQRHDVVSHEEWFKWSGAMVVIVQRFGANWGYLVMRSDKSRWTVLSGQFDRYWTATDACEIAEEAWGKATGVAS